MTVLADKDLACMDHSFALEEAARLVQHSYSAAAGKSGEGAEAHDAGIYVTVEDALESIGYGKFQLGMVAYAGLAWLADAAEVILLSFIGPAAKCEWGLSATQEGAISSVVFLGLFVGAYVWGLLSDLKGRKVGFLATVIFTVVFGLMSAWSPTFIWLLISRALVGFGLGGSAVVFNLCMEFLPPSRRGFWLVFLEVFWTAGSILEALLAWIILPNLNWRLLVGVSALPFFLLLIFYPALPESPRYLLVKGDKEGARAVLRRVARVNKQAMPDGTLILARAPPAVSPSTLDNSHVPEVADGSHLLTWEASKEQRGPWDTYKSLFSSQLRTTTALLWFNFFANAFTYYGLVLLTTQLSSGQQQCDASLKGRNALPLCLPDGKPNTDTWTYKEVLITSFAELPGLLIACLTVEKFGRRASLVALLFGCAAFLFPLLAPLPVSATTVLLFGARACIMGAFSVLWVFAPELYPTKIRSSALGFANGASRVGGFLCPFVAVGLVENCYRVWAVSLFSGFSLLAGAASVFFPVETKGLKLSDDFN